MSLKQKAAQVRAAGNKRGDSILAHITPEEAALLKARGGAGVQDSDTGLLHFYDTGDSEAPGAADNAGNANDSSQGSGLAAGGYADGMGPAGTPGLGSMGYGEVSSQGTTNVDILGRPINDVSTAPSAFDSLADYTDTPGMSSVGTGYGDPESQASMSSQSDMAETPSWMDFAEKKAKSLAANFAIGKVAQTTSLPGSLLGLATNLATSKSPEAQGKAFGSSFGSTAGSMIGGMFGGPVGAVAGGMLGSSFGEGLGAREKGRSDADRTDAVGSTNATGLGGIDYGSLLQGGLGLYQGYQASQDARESAGVARQQTQSLQNMFGPDSAYAQQLRQGLERKDAQAGRRSQYGPREVELQAKLAEMQVRNAPNILAANTQANTMRQGANRTNAQVMASGLDMAKKSGLLSYAQRGLSDMFSPTNSGNGNSGFTDTGTSYNNPSAYTAPETTGGFWDY